MTRSAFWHSQAEVQNSELANNPTMAAPLLVANSTVMVRHRKLATANVLLASLFFFNAIAQAERLPLRTYTTADGLANNEVNKVVRDSRGFLWFCTSGGLSRFDGYAFTNFGVEEGLPDPVVNDFLETRAGDYWLATNGGLVHFNPRGSTTSHPVYANDSLSSSAMFVVAPVDEPDRQAKVVNVLVEDALGLWCGTNKGLYRLEVNGGSPKLRAIDLGIPGQYAEQSFIQDLVIDRNGSLWAGAPSGLYRRWPDGTTARYGLKDGLPGDYLQTLFVDDRGRLWAGTRDSGLFQFLADSTHAAPQLVDSYSPKNGFPTGWIYRLFEASDGSFWAGTNAGLIEFYPDSVTRGHEFQAYSSRNGLSYHEITAVNEDLGGNLWLGTTTAGAMKLAHNGFRTYGPPDGIAVVNDIFEDQAGDLCFRGAVLGDARTSVFEGGRVDLLRSPQDFYYQRFGELSSAHFNWFKLDAVPRFGWVAEHVTLHTRSGEWWVGTSDGLYRFAASETSSQLRTTRPLKLFTVTDGLAAAQIFRLFEDQHGDVWISSISSAKSGLARWNPATGKLEDLSNAPGLPLPNTMLPRAFGEDAGGDVWIGFSGGVARYRDGSFKFFSVSNDSAPGAVVQIYLDLQHRLWLASARNGLVAVQNPDSPHPVFKSYTTAQGLSSNEAQVITDDLDGRIYIGGGRGLDQLDPEAGRVKHFTVADGLSSGAFLAAFRDHRGELWFGTTSGLSRYRPAPNENANAPTILISSLQVAGSRQPVSVLGESAIALPELGATQNQVQIDFLGLSFAPGEVMRYQYLLEGVDHDWSAPTEQRAVNYGNLAPRSYRFLVRAINSNGTISAVPASVSFTILPPIWRRWWFVSLLVLLICATIYVFYRYRVSRLVEVANIRTRIAADLHDDIGSNLTRIAILSEVAHSHFQDDGQEIGSQLLSIAEISRESVASMSDIVWAINPKRDTLLDLVQRMRRFATEILVSRGIEFLFHAPELDHELKLGANTRRNIFLVFKEALHNATRHSSCKTVTVDLKIERSWLILQVRDDGIGFDQGSNSDGHGFVSMTKRSRDLRGQLRVSSKPGEGTEISLRVPL